MKTPYTSVETLQQLVTKIGEYGALQSEWGNGEAVRQTVESLQPALEQALARIRALQPEPQLAAQEPDELEAIRRLRTEGPRRLTDRFDDADLENRMAGALLGRFAGCTLGVPVESYSIEQMQQLAAFGGIEYPPREYWPYVDRPYQYQSKNSRRDRYTRDGMHGVSTDDDLSYTMLGLLVLEKFGLDFTLEQLGTCWTRYLPYACTAEGITLKNLQQGVPAEEAGKQDNPYCQWIGAAIRCDPWAYAAAGNPELAASMAYRDARMSHCRNGVYGAMLMAAAEAAAFAANDPLEAIRIGLTEIPKDCLLYRDVTWALEVCDSVLDYAHARALVDERFEGMHAVHMNNNACLIVFGLKLGGGNYTETIANTVAMGLDNDCTAATAGSILSAIIGKRGIEEHWIRPFGNTISTFLIGAEELAIDDVIARFIRLVRTHTGR